MNEPLTHTIECCAEVNHLRTQLTTTMEAMRLLGEKHDAVCAQRDEARARVAGLEAQVEAIRKASTELVNLAPLGGDLRVMIMSLSAQGLSEKDEKYTFEYERALKATHDALAALSADPLKVGEAAMAVDQQWKCSREFRVSTIGRELVSVLDALSAAMKEQSNG